MMYNCGTERIQGVNSQGFVPNQNGSYQVKITVPGCGSVFSDCVEFNTLGTEKDIFSNILKKYPNPSRRQFTN